MEEPLNIKTYLSEGLGRWRSVIPMTGARLPSLLSCAFGEQEETGTFLRLTAWAGEEKKTRQAVGQWPHYIKHLSASHAE